MILGIGIDSVQVKRFNEWSTLCSAQLKKVFSEEEINYCLKTPRLSAERFAVRFAVREAFFKALSATHKSSVSFLKACKAVQLIHANNQVPLLQVDWSNVVLDKKVAYESFIVHCSLTHTRDTATACVIIEVL
jgi:holo-[acyl-carrier protein] synthase